MKRMFFILFCLAVSVGTVAPAFAETEANVLSASEMKSAPEKKAVFGPELKMPEPDLIGSFGDWNAYRFVQRGEKICFMMSHPRKQEGQFKKRDDVLFYVTQWPGEKNREVISVLNGYTFRDKSPVTLTVADMKFNLFSEGDMAWTKDAEMDTAVMAAFEKGEKMVVEGTSKRGTLTTDTYSLKGSGDAYRALTKECTVKTGK